jgi:predicted RNase H-like nuclease (RuvC/YqgF family)
VTLTTINSSISHFTREGIIIAKDVEWLGADDLQELKDDIKNLDRNVNKKLEKHEENLNKFMEMTSTAINKMAEAIFELKISMAKEYVEKQDLEKLDKKINNVATSIEEEIDKVEINLTEKININNNNRKQDNEKTNARIDCIEKSNVITISTVVKYFLALGIGTSFGYLFSLVFK